MTLKIEMTRAGTAMMIRLIGRIQSEHVAELEQLMKCRGSNVSLDLEDVSLVDAEVVRFLTDCMARGVQLRRCPAYVTEWIEQEKRFDR